MAPRESARRGSKRPLRAAQCTPDVGSSSEHPGGSTSGQQMSAEMPAPAADAIDFLKQHGEGGRCSKRHRGVVQPDCEATGSNSVGAPAAERPTAAERREALNVIQQMKAADPPLLSKRAPARPEVVACAIALWRGERFANDRAALRLFGAHPETKIREAWVGKLDAFAPAGFGTPGPALPTYLLDRDELLRSRADAQSSSSEESSSGSEDYAEDEERRLERRVNRWSCDAAAQDARWQREQDEAKARRAREAAEWDAAHGAKCEAEHASLRVTQPAFYWALACEIGRQPKWQLRKGECLEADATCTISDDEPLLRYRGFRPFRADGNLMKAAEVFGGSPDYEWLSAERARLEPGSMEATRPSRPRCVECGERECVCPEWEDDPSVDCHYEGADDHERFHQQELRDCVQDDAADPHELQCDRVLEEQGRIAQIHGRPWDEVPPGSTAPVHWLDSTEEGGPVDRPWERAEHAERQRRERELNERFQRMARNNIPPPHRSDERYGPLANNAAGDEAFRADRSVWYEHVTGESLEGLSLTEQWERVDVIARRFRDYTDGRPARTREEMPT